MIKEAMAAETHKDVNCASVCFSIANLLKEPLNVDSESHPLPIMECNNNIRRLQKTKSTQPVLNRRLHIDTALLR